MIHIIKKVKPLKNRIVLAQFQDGTEKKYDIKQLYPDYPQFKVFETNPELFEQVILEPGGCGIRWNDDLDLDAEEIWYSGIPTGVIHEISEIEQLAVNLTYARFSVGMYQCDLAEATGIRQGDISDIERGKANPTIKTLSRLAEGMGMRLKIEFVPKEPNA